MSEKNSLRLFIICYLHFCLSSPSPSPCTIQAQRQMYDVKGSDNAHYKHALCTWSKKEQLDDHIYLIYFSAFDVFWQNRTTFISCREDGKYTCRTHNFLYKYLYTSLNYTICYYSQYNLFEYRSCIYKTKYPQLNFNQIIYSQLNNMASEIRNLNKWNWKVF